LAEIKYSLSGNVSDCSVKSAKHYEVEIRALLEYLRYRRFEQVPPFSGISGSAECSEEDHGRVAGNAEQVAGDGLFNRSEYRGV
jgi:hypothetical protein